MNRWIDLYNLKATFESDSIKLDSMYDFYITKITPIYEANDGLVKVYIKTSFDDGLTWGEWHDIEDTFYVNEFDSGETQLNEFMMKYKVLMDMSNKYDGVSPIFKGISFELTGANKIVNYGDVVCKPELWIRKTNKSGDIKIINETNNIELEIKNVNLGEEIYIDCENMDIVSSLSYVYRYNDHNGQFLELEVGSNILHAEGDFQLDMRYEFKTLQG